MCFIFSPFLTVRSLSGFYGGKMGKIVGIIQARMGSTRLPGKSMMKIVGKPLLEHVIKRVKKCKTLDCIVVATTKKKEDDVIVNLAEKLGVCWFRGSENDVLDRFLKAAEKFNANIIVRICADNPLIDPEEVDRLVKHHLETNADYSYNHIPYPEGLPDGAGAEVLTIDTLRKVHKLATKQEHREHVTLYILENLDLFRTERLSAKPELRKPQYRLDVDYMEDLEFIREIYRRLYKPGKIIKLKDVIKLLDKQPELLKIRRER